MKGTSHNQNPQIYNMQQNFLVLKISDCLEKQTLSIKSTSTSNTAITEPVVNHTSMLIREQCTCVDDFHKYSFIASLHLAGGLLLIHYGN